MTSILNSNPLFSAAVSLVLSNWRKIILIICGWTLFALISATQSYLNYGYSGRPRPYSQVASVWFICAGIWALMTPLALWLAKRFRVTREHLLSSIALHVLGGSLIAVLQLGVYVFVARVLVINPSTRFGPWEQFRDLFFTEFQANLLLYIVLVAFYQAFDYHRRYRERERRAAQLEVEAAHLETQLTRAQLDALRMQMNPHFLFNTLNSVSVLMQEDVVLANQMLLHLSELLRLTLNQEQTHEVTLRQELDFLRLYLEIEQTRFQDRLKVKIEAAPETLEARVPNLILHSLVENAIRHAVAPRASETLVVIRSERLNGNLLLLVSDNGDGIAAKSESANGIGLANTRSRLEKLYGAKQEFVLHAAANGGVEASVTIPFRTGSEDSK